MSRNGISSYEITLGSTCCLACCIAVEARAPTRAEFERERGGHAAADKQSPSKGENSKARVAGKPGTPRSGRRIIPEPGRARKAAGRADPDLPRETLIVASKLKQYVKAKAGLSTSERVMGPLSDAVRRLCDEAIENALADERKTLLDRDFES